MTAGLLRKMVMFLDVTKIRVWRANYATAAKDLEAQGYTHVLRYVGGKQDWTDAGMSLEGAPAKASTPSRETVSASSARAGR